MNQEMDYQKAYEEEHLRNADLAGRIADLEAKCDDLNFKLNRIKSNPLWKMSSPACVEMEGCAIAQACWLNKTPFVIIRCMSDMADDLSSNGYEFNEGIAAQLSAQVVEKLIEAI